MGEKYTKHPSSAGLLDPQQGNAFTRFMQDPRLLQALRALAPAITGAIGGPAMGFGVQQQLGQQDALLQQQQEAEAMRRHREQQLGIQRQELGMRQQGMDVDTQMAGIKADTDSAKARADLMKGALAQFESGLAGIDTQDEKGLGAYARGIAEASGMGIDDTMKFLRLASSRAKLKPAKKEPPARAAVPGVDMPLSPDVEAQRVRMTKESRAEKPDSGLSAKVAEFREVFKREPTQPELQRLAGVAPPQPPASIQIAQGQDIGALADALGRGEMKPADVPIAVRDKAMRTANERGYQVLSDVEREKVGQLDKVAPVLDAMSQLSERINTGRGVVAKITGEVEKAKALANLNDDVAEYQAMVSGFTPLVARAVGHVGVLTEQDVQSVRQLFPSPTDSKTLRDRKVKRINEIFAGVKGAMKGSYTKPITGGGAEAGGAPKPTHRYNPQTKKLEPVQ